MAFISAWNLLMNASKAKVSSGSRFDNRATRDTRAEVSMTDGLLPPFSFAQIFVCYMKLAKLTCPLATVSLFLFITACKKNSHPSSVHGTLY